VICPAHTTALVIQTPACHHPPQNEKRDKKEKVDNPMMVQASSPELEQNRD